MNSFSSYQKCYCTIYNTSFFFSNAEIFCLLLDSLVICPSFIISVAIMLFLIPSPKFHILLDLWKSNALLYPLQIISFPSTFCSCSGFYLVHSQFADLVYLYMEFFISSKSLLKCCKILRLILIFYILFNSFFSVLWMFFQVMNMQS